MVCTHLHSDFQRWKEITARNCEKSDDANFDSVLSLKAFFCLLFPFGK